MTTRHADRSVIAGDVGGTKTNIGLFRGGADRPILEADETYSSTGAAELEDLIKQFLGDHPAKISVGCFGIAGPVVSQTSKTTNLPWVVRADTIALRFGWPRVELVNDLAATAYAIPILRSNDVENLNSGTEREGPVGVLAPGTGLGVALGIFVDGRIRPIASEGGHVDFAPQTNLQIELFRHLREEYGHVSVERLVSGPGLYAIYGWLKRYRGYHEPGWLREQLESRDPSRVVSEAALAGDCEICAEALDLFVSLMGAAAGNLALTGMTTRGMYLGGGIPPKILAKLHDGTFMDAFTAKGRFAEVLAAMPVRVILNDRAALLGAADHALELADLS